MSQEVVVGLYLVCIPAGLIALNLWLDSRQASADRPARRKWDRFDWAALALVAIALLLRFWNLDQTQITSDEATNLEPGFWSNWFGGWETKRNPPLFRFLIHMFPSDQLVPLWLIRAPSALFGSLGVFLIYLLARQRCRGPWALAAAAMLCFYPLHVRYSQWERAYVLLLCFLLLSHMARHAANEGRKWTWSLYGIFASLAVFTHYLAPIFLLGHVIDQFLNQRRKVFRLLIAMAPVVAVAAPFAINILMDAGNVSQGLPFSTHWHEIIGKQLYSFFLDKGGLVFVLAAAAIVSVRRPVGPETADLLWPAICVGVVALFMGPAPRYFFPIMPMLFVWLVCQMDRKASDLAMWRKSFVLACVLGITLLTTIIRLVAGPGFHQRGMRELAQACRQSDSNARTRRVIAIHPASAFHVMLFELTGRRDWWQNDCGSPESGFFFQDDEVTLLTVGEKVSPAKLEEAIGQLDRMEVFYLATKRDVARPGNDEEVKNWLESRCQLHERIRGEGDLQNAYYVCSGPVKGKPDHCSLLDWKLR